MKRIALLILTFGFIYTPSFAQKYRLSLNNETGVYDPSAVWASLNGAKGKKTINCVPYRTHSWPSGDRQAEWREKYLKPREEFIRNYLK